MGVLSCDRFQHGMAHTALHVLYGAHGCHIIILPHHFKNICDHFRNAGISLVHAKQACVGCGGADAVVVAGTGMERNAYPFNPEPGEQQFIYLFSVLVLWEVLFDLREREKIRGEIVADVKILSRLFERYIIHIGIVAYDTVYAEAAGFRDRF